MNVQIEPTWKAHLGQEFEKPYFTQLTQAVRQEYMQTTCYPPGKLIFNAFNLCPFDQVKVVIIGQDPYHEPGQAHGLSFSVQDGVMFPPSLQNIFKEIQADLGTPIPTSGRTPRLYALGWLCPFEGLYDRQTEEPCARKCPSLPSQRESWWLVRPASVLPLQRLS